MFCIISWIVSGLYIIDRPPNAFQIGSSKMGQKIVQLENGNLHFSVRTIEGSVGLELSTSNRSKNSKFELDQSGESYQVRYDQNAIYHLYMNLTAIF